MPLEYYRINFVLYSKITNTQFFGLYRKTYFFSFIRKTRHLKANDRPLFKLLHVQHFCLKKMSHIVFPILNGAYIKNPQDFFQLKYGKWSLSDPFFTQKF